MPSLTFNNGKSFNLQSGTNQIGHDSQQIQLNDSSVSSTHAKITKMEDGGLTIEDLGSTNGTFLNGSQLSPNAQYNLQNDDKLTFGVLEATLQMEDSFNSPAVLNQQISANKINQYAGFWARFAALFIDGLILFIVNLIIGATFSSLPESSKNWLPNLIALGVNWFYFAHFTSSEAGATPGKKALNIKVIDFSGNQISLLRATSRYFAKFLSSILFIGYFIQPFTQRKQALHDLIAKTIVIKVN